MPHRGGVAVADLPPMRFLGPAASGRVVDGALVDHPWIAALRGLEDGLGESLRPSVAASGVTGLVGELERTLTGSSSGS